MIAATGATGHLGRHVMNQLLEGGAAEEVVAAVRSPDRAGDLAARGVHVRRADYDAPETLAGAFQGVDKLLLISANELGKRVQQHRAAVAAAKKASVKLLVYTSLLHADTSGISLAGEHLATEKAIREAGIPFVILRNGWYLENYTENLGPALRHGVMLGAAKAGRIAAASRADYAAAAVTVLTARGHAGKVYELAGDTSFTRADLAAEVARQSGKPVAYSDMPAATYAETLRGLGVPGPVADMLASADEGIARGELDDRSGDLRRLIGRPTATLAEAVAEGLKRV
ncbi:MAG TPA: NAD(P)H-binding protein [Anaeromyxobacteraceae bacterium]|nr:NAD(P)H-binding protein [Anaeromyxobacteraceae bacterium]